MPKPLLSVCIPMYNCQNFIEDGLRSICNQAIKNKLEVIIVDDCSTDDSYEIAKRYIEQNNLNGKICKNIKNSGETFTRNRAINEAEGEYAIFLDADDMLCEYSLDRVMQVAIKDNLDMVIASYQNVDANLKILSVCKNKNENSSGKAVAEQLSNFNIIMCIGCYIIKTSILKQNHIQSTIGYKYGGDQQLNYLCLLHSNKVMMLDVPIYNYRVNPNSAMNTKANFNRFDVYKTRVELLQYIKEKFPDQTKLIERFKNVLLPEAIIVVIRVLCYSNVKIQDLSDFLTQNNYDKVMKNTLGNHNAPKLMKIEIFFWLYLKYLYAFSCKLKKTIVG